MSKGKLNERITKMKNEMKKLRECSKKKVLRLIQKGEIDFKDGVFINKFTQEPIELQVKTKYKDESEDELDEDDIKYEDFLDKSGSFLDEK